MKYPPAQAALVIGCLILAFANNLGCGPAPSVHPTSELTEEQKAAIKAEDARIADEESHGTVNKKTKKR